MSLTFYYSPQSTASLTERASSGRGQHVEVSAQISVAQATQSYILAHSFTKFLANALGTTRLVSIHRADDVHALAKISGVSNAEWERRWMAHGPNRRKAATWDCTL